MPGAAFAGLSLPKPKVTIGTEVEGGSSWSTFEIKKKKKKD